MSAPADAAPRRDAGWWFVAASVAAAVLAAVFLAVAPMVTVVEESSQTVSVGSTSLATASPRPEATATRTLETRTLPETEGWGSVAFIAVPPLIVSAMPLVTRRRWPAAVLRTVAAVLLLGWVLLGAFSFGIFYLPSAALMLVAAILAYVGS